MANIMQKSSLASNQNAPPFFTTPVWGGNGSGSGSGNGREESRKHTKTGSIASITKSRHVPGPTSLDPLAVPESKDRDRKPSFGRKSSFAPSDRGRRRSSTSGGGLGSLDEDESLYTDSSIPPAIPDFLANSRATRPEIEVPPTPSTLIDSFTFSRSSSRATPSAASAAMTSYYPFAATSPPSTGAPTQMQLPPIEGSSSMVHTHIFETSTKRIHTLEYLRKSYGTSSYAPLRTVMDRVLPTC